MTSARETRPTNPCQSLLLGSRVGQTGRHSQKRAVQPLQQLASSASQRVGLLARVADQCEVAGMLVNEGEGHCGCDRREGSEAWLHVAWSLTIREEAVPIRTAFL